MTQQLPQRTIEYIQIVLWKYMKESTFSFLSELTFYAYDSVETAAAGPHCD